MCCSMVSIEGISPKMLINNQNFQDPLTFAVIAIALIAGAFTSIDPLIFEFTTNESSDTPIIEEIDGDILDPTHPFQVEKSLEGLKNSIKQVVRIIIPTESALEYIANLPDAGSGPENPDNLGSEFNNEPNNSPSENTQSNYGINSQNPISKNNLSIDLTNNEATVLDRVQSVLESTDESFVKHCTDRGPGAKLQHCDFRGDNLYGTVLTDADLRDTDFSNAFLMSAYLKNADLSYSNLNGANLRYVNLEGANLDGASLIDTDLTGATIDSCQLGEKIGVDLNGDDVIDVYVIKYYYYGSCWVLEN